MVKEDQGSLEFPGKDSPDQTDFAHSSFVIGMTFQVADVSINSRQFRHMALFHGLILANPATAKKFVPTVGSVKMLIHHSGVHQKLSFFIKTTFIPAINVRSQSAQYFIPGSSDLR
jgi:hypothetical protein